MRSLTRSGRPSDLRAGGVTPFVKCEGDATIERAELLRRVTSERREAALRGRSVEAVRLRLEYSNNPDFFRVPILFESYSDPSGSVSFGNSCILVCEGSLSDEPSKGFSFELAIAHESALHSRTQAPRNPTGPDVGRGLLVFPERSRLS